MKRVTFFSEEFLNEVENEVRRLNRQINCSQPFGHPAELSPDEIGIIARFYNKLLFLLRAGERISEKTYRESIEILSYEYLKSS